MSLSKERAALNDLGLWLGVEANNYVKIASFIEAVSEGPNRDEFLKAFHLVHNVFRRVVND